MIWFAISRLIWLYTLATPRFPTPDRTDDIAFARAEMDDLGLPYLIVPGNHDVGDNPLQAEWLAKQPKPCTEARRAAWIEQFGPDFWSQTRGDWTFIGLNAQLFGTGMPAETEQWAMLEEAVRKPSRKVLVSHKPLYNQTDGCDLPLNAIPEADSLSLEAMLASSGVELFLSGHLHRHKVIERNFMRVWGASTAFICSHQHMARRGGIMQVGIQEVTLGEAPAVTFLPALSAINMDIWTWLEPGSGGLGEILERPSRVIVNQVGLDDA